MIEGIIGGILGLAIIGLVVYYVKSGVNSARDAADLAKNNKALQDELDRVENKAIEIEDATRKAEAAKVPGISRDAANRMLLDAVKDDDLN